MLTADTVVENVRELVRRAGGRAIVWSNVGLADFSSFSNSPVSHSVVIKVADFDTSYAQEQARKRMFRWKLLSRRPCRRR